MRSPARPLAVVTSIVLGVAAFAAPASAAKRSRTYQCDGQARRVLQRGAQPTVLNAVTKISTRNIRCRTTISTVANMMLQVGASAPTLTSQNPRFWFADDADFWRKNGWTIAHVSGDPSSAAGARWHVTKGRMSLRFTRYM